jgi:hypothetical protein
MNSKCETSSQLLVSAAVVRKSEVEVFVLLRIGTERDGTAAGELFKLSFAHL